MKVQNMKWLWTLEAEDRKFGWISFFAMVIISGFLMLQNVIRYGMHASYDPMVSIIYLFWAFLLFLIWLPLLIHFNKLLLLKSEQRFWSMLVVISLTTILVHVLLSGFLLRLCGYYDYWIFDTKFLSSYFGRIVLYHGLLCLSVGLYVRFGKTTETKKKTITGSVGRKKITVPSDLVNWIEADDHYARIHISDRQILKRATLDELGKYLSPEFVRIHRKYLVNRSAIKGLEKKNRTEHILLKNGEKLKVGPTYVPFNLY